MRLPYIGASLVDDAVPATAARINGSGGLDILSRGALHLWKKERMVPRVVRIIVDFEWNYKKKTIAFVLGSGA